MPDLPFALPLEAHRFSARAFDGVPGVEIRDATGRAIAMIVDSDGADRESYERGLADAQALVRIVNESASQAEEIRIQTDKAKTYGEMACEANRILGGIPKRLIETAQKAANRQAAAEKLAEAVAANLETEGVVAEDPVITDSRLAMRTALAAFRGATG